RAPARCTGSRGLPFGVGTPSLGLFGRLSEHLPHLALFLERERVVHLLGYHHAVLTYRPNSAVKQFVAWLDDVGLVVGTLKDADKATLAGDGAFESDLVRLESCEARGTGAGRWTLRIGAAAQQAHKWIAPPLG